MKPLDLSHDAPWRKRYLATDIIWAVTASQNPDRALVCTNKDGIYQLYAWDIPTLSVRVDALSEDPWAERLTTRQTITAAMRRRVLGT